MNNDIIIGRSVSTQVLITKICTGSLTEVNTLLRFASINTVTETATGKRRATGKSDEQSSMSFLLFSSKAFSKHTWHFLQPQQLHLFYGCCGWKNFTILPHENYTKASLLRHISSVHSISFHLLSSWRCVSASKANAEVIHMQRL